MIFPIWISGLCILLRVGMFDRCRWQSARSIHVHSTNRAERSVRVLDDQFIDTCRCRARLSYAIEHKHSNTTNIDIVQ
jgi:hypothetical protein